MKRMTTLIFLSLLLLFSCAGKRETTQANILVLGALSAGLDGGIMIYGQNRSTGESFAISHGNGSESKILELTNGDWSFTAIAWEGPNELQGEATCALAEETLEGEEVSLSLLLSTDQCDHGGRTNSDLSFATCASLNVLNPGATVAADCPLRGQAQSYRLILYNQTEEGRVDTNGGFSSQCVDDATLANNAPTHDSGLQLPPILLASEEMAIPIVIEAFNGLGCTGTRQTYSFASGPAIESRDGAIVYQSNRVYAVLVSQGSCPNGFVPVRGNTSLGTNNFCVMQYEAKEIVGEAASLPGSLPWVNITAADAQTQCNFINDPAFPGTFTLISNPEWMTIVRDLEGVPSNWSGGIVGDGHIPRGHSDASPNNALPVADTNDPYSGTGNTSGEPPGSGWEQRRTHTLSNGSVIWDFSGNVMEWVDWKPDPGLSLGPTDADFNFQNLNILSGTLIDADDLQPSGGYDDSQSFGQWFGGTTGTAYRGGSWDAQDIAGVAMLSLFTNTNQTQFHGFRCVYRP